jgi:hypothetical protein
MTKIPKLNDVPRAQKSPAINPTRDRTAADAATKIVAAFRNWIRKFAHPPNVPDNLRHDVGLSERYEKRHWHDLR